MANCIIVLGPSGVGKSTSISTLNPRETVIFNILKKRLPFKGSQSLYNEANKNLFNIDTYDTIIKYLEAIDKKMPNVKNIVLDDSIFIMRKEFFKRAKESGFSKFTELATHFQNIISTAESLRSDLNVFFILHSEDVVNDGAIVGNKVATVGKLLDSQYNPIEVVPMVLCADVVFDEKEIPKYGFWTHRVMKGGYTLCSKTPKDMFEDDFIPNDLQLVVDKMNEYYN